MSRPICILLLRDDNRFDHFAALDGGNRLRVVAESEPMGDHGCGANFAGFHPGGDGAQIVDREPLGAHRVNSRSKIG